MAIRCVAASLTSRTAETALGSYPGIEFADGEWGRRRAGTPELYRPVTVCRDRARGAADKVHTRR
jgi:hypothetical protein